MADGRKNRWPKRRSHGGSSGNVTDQCDAGSGSKGFHHSTVMKNQRFGTLLVAGIWTALLVTGVATYPAWGYQSGFFTLWGKGEPAQELPALRKRISFLPGAEFRLAGPLPENSLAPGRMSMYVWRSPRSGAPAVGSLTIEIR